MKSVIANDGDENCSRRRREHRKEFPVPRQALSLVRAMYPPLSNVIHIVIRSPWSVLAGRSHKYIPKPRREWENDVGDMTILPTEDGTLLDEWLTNHIVKAKVYNGDSHCNGSNNANGWSNNCRQTTLPPIICSWRPDGLSERATELRTATIPTHSCHPLLLLASLRRAL